MPIAEPTATYGNLRQKRNQSMSVVEESESVSKSVTSGSHSEEGVCNGYVTAVSVALSGGARTVSINKIWKNLGTFLLATVSLSPGLTVNGR